MLSLCGALYSVSTKTGVFPELDINIQTAAARILVRDDQIIMLAVYHWGLKFLIFGSYVSSLTMELEQHGGRLLIGEVNVMKRIKIA
jgi:hypothetical protein